MHQTQLVLSGSVWKHDLLRYLPILRKEEFMKKHIIIIMNIILVAVVLGAVAFAVLKIVNNKQEPVPTEAPTIAQATFDEPTAAPQKLYKVGIVQNGLGNASKDCYEGFISELNERGVLQNLDIVYIVEDDKEECKKKIENLVSDKCDLLYTIGRYATEASAEATKDIPIIFGAVNSPDEIGLVESNEAPGGNVTGVSNFTPCFEQIDLIKLLMPGTKSIAVIYTGTDADSISQAIVATKESDIMGMTCDKYPVANEKEIDNALSKIKTEVIYVPVDLYISGNIDKITEFSYENNIPVICGDEDTLLKGALATSVINYAYIGRVAAGMANDVLFNEKDTATLSVIYKHDCNNLVNKEIADKLGVKIPSTAMKDIQFVEPPTTVPTEKPTTAE